MPDIKVRVGQTNAVKVVASAFGGSLTAENAVNATNVLGGIASVTQLYNSGITTFLSNLYVAGITTLAASGGITTTGGDFYVGGDLYINDDVVLDEVTARNVNVSGTTTTTNLLVTGISTLSGPVGLGSYLNVTGISTFNDDVKFIGATSNARWDASTSDLILFDNTRLEFGSNKDFEIWHGGSHTFMKNSGGDLRIRGDVIKLAREDGTETYLEANVNNEVKLFFNGNEKFATTNNGVIVTGIATATDFDSTSDIRLKTNIKPIEDPLNKVMQIEGVSFNWKSDNKPSLGVIADNVEEVLPEIVSGNDPKSVNYNGLIGLLIEVVKDQQKQIDELRGLLDK